MGPESSRPSTAGVVGWMLMAGSVGRLVGEIREPGEGTGIVKRWEEEDGLGGWELNARGVLPT